jgi:basic membrane protein A and related proteins
MNSWIKAAGAVAIAAGLAAPAVAADKLKVGFVYVGPVGDFGYSYQHDQGRLAVEKALGDKVTTTYLENVPEADSERSIEQLARSGHKLIFTTSFGFMDPTVKVAKKYPDVKFEHATGYKREKNLATYSARFHEGRYVQGVIAGKMTKANIIGYVASFPIPEVVSGINAFMLGAQSVNPAVKVKIVWANTWFDPGKEADAAKALLDQGADIITQHTDSPAPLQQAEARGKFAFGQASDMIRFAPKATLTSNVDHWDDYYIARTKAVLDGTWKSEDTWGGFAANMLQMAPFTNMPDDVKKLAVDTVDAIKSGKLDPFKCPVYGQDGKEVACKGKGALADEQVLSMNWYIKGIDDKLPQ